MESPFLIPLATLSDKEFSLVVNFPKGEARGYVKMITHPDDGIGFEGPVRMTATLSDFLVLKGVRRTVDEDTSSESESSDSESDSDSESAEEGEVDNLDEDENNDDDGNMGHSFTNLSPASDYNSDEIREQEKWGSRCEESKSGGRRGNPKEGRPLNRPANSSRTASTKKAGTAIREKRLHSDEVEAYRTN